MASRIESERRTISNLFIRIKRKNDRVRSRLNEVLRDRILPMTPDTLKEKNLELYELLKVKRS